jgi:uncharacterized protein DUF3987
MKAVPNHLLEALAQSPDISKLSRMSQSPANGAGTSFEIERWIAEHGLEVIGPRSWQAGRRWVFRVCPWNPEHRDRSAYLVQFASGAIASGCHHNSCTGKDWYALRDLVEPGWQDRRNGTGVIHQTREAPHGGPLPSDITMAPSVQAAPNQVEPFPLEVLPDQLARFMKEGAMALHCPPDLIGVPLLVIAGSTIGTARVLEVKPGWHEGARIYGTGVAEPGAVKSPALDLVARPLYRKQQTLVEEFTKKEQAYKADMALYEVQLQVWKERARKAARGEGPDQGEPPEEPKEPTLARVFTSDVTVEALAVLLQQNPRGLVLIRDELTGWVRAMVIAQPPSWNCLTFPL